MNLLTLSVTLALGPALLANQPETKRTAAGAKVQPASPPAATKRPDNPAPTPLDAAGEPAPRPSKAGHAHISHQDHRPVAAAAFLDCKHAPPVQVPGAGPKAPGKPAAGSQRPAPISMPAAPAAARVQRSMLSSIEEDSPVRLIGSMDSLTESELTALDALEPAQTGGPESMLPLWLDGLAGGPARSKFPTLPADTFIPATTAYPVINPKGGYLELTLAECRHRDDDYTYLHSAADPARIHVLHKDGRTRYPLVPGDTLTLYRQAPPTDPNYRSHGYVVQGHDFKSGKHLFIYHNVSFQPAGPEDLAHWRQVRESKAGLGKEPARP